MDHGKSWPSPKFKFLAANMQHQAIVRCVQRHTTFTDPAFRTTHVKPCCNFGEWLCQPVRYCTRQEHVDRPWYKIINGNPYYYKQLSLQRDGITQAKEFLQERLLLSSKIVFGPITRNNMLTVVKKKYIAKRNSLTTAEVNRDVLGNLLRLIMKSGQVIDFMEVLKYPLSPIPMSLSFP